MNLDEAIRLARMVEAGDYGDSSVDMIPGVLASAVLAMAPVVEAAREWQAVRLCSGSKAARMALFTALSTLSSKVPHGE